MDIRETHIIGITTRERIVTPRFCPALSIYGIQLAGISETGPDFLFLRKNPSLLQILACVSGEGMVLVNGAWTPCASNFAYVTPPGHSHGYKATANSPWRLAWVIYDPYGDISGASMNARVAKPTIMPGDFGTLSSTIDLLYFETMGGADPAIMHHLAALLDSYARRAVEPKGRLASVWDCVRSDLSSAWTVPQLAEIAGVSGEHLRRLSIMETGLSPARYVTCLRMREAATLLSSASYKLAQIADRVGYENVFAFSTAFTRHFGEPPSTYRERTENTRGPDEGA